MAEGKAPIRQLAVVFADVRDSSRLFEQLGDDPARRVVTSILDALERVAHEGGGRVVDRIGDELMATFDSASDAALAAVAMQNEVRELTAQRLSVPVSVRIGFHAGKVIVDGGRLFGDTVYTAKRMASLAQGEQVFTTADTLAQLDAEVHLPTRFVPVAAVKGKRGHFQVHEVLWDASAVTVGSTNPPPPPSPIPAGEPSLELTCGARRAAVGTSRSSLTLGRAVDCDLIFEHRGVSRHHARVEHRAGAFFLVDHSSNGTRLQPRRGPARTLHRGETELAGSGRITLGARAGHRDPPILSYRVRRRPDDR